MFTKTIEMVKEELSQRTAALARWEEATRRAVDLMRQLNELAAEFPELRQAIVAGVKDTPATPAAPPQPQPVVPAPAVVQPPAPSVSPEPVSTAATPATPPVVAAEPAAEGVPPLPDDPDALVNRIVSSFRKHKNRWMTLGRLVTAKYNGTGDVDASPEGVRKVMVRNYPHLFESRKAAEGVAHEYRLKNPGG